MSNDYIERELRAIWTAKGVPAKRQDNMIAEIVGKAQPGARVGPFILGGSIEATPAGAQHVLPGAGKASQAELARRRAAAPLKPAKAQAACDLGLFSDDAKQVELF